MAIYRIKRFSVPNPQAMYGQNIPGDPMPQPPTSRELQLETLRLRREIYEKQRQEQRVREDERRQKLQDLRELQKQENNKNIEDNKNINKMDAANKSNISNPGERNLGLYKTTTTAVKPIPMS